MYRECPRPKSEGLPLCDFMRVRMRAAYQLIKFTLSSHTL
jgi:hypothetical protein